MNEKTIRRLRVLEDSLPEAIERDPDEADMARACQVVDHLAATMTAEHLDYFREWIFEDRENPISREFERRFNRAMNGSQRPLALPGPVAAVYLEPVGLGEAIGNLHECADCGYELPIKTGLLTGGEYLANVRKSGTRYFEKCPLCGGEVGYCAFYLKNGFHPGEAA